MVQNREIRAEPGLIRARFGDFDHFADAARGWNLDFRQTDRGRLSAEILRFDRGETALQRVRISRGTDQRGASPAGTRTFALLAENRPGTRWCRQEMTYNAVASFGSGGDFEALARPGFSVFTFSLPESRIPRVARLLGRPDPDRWLGTLERMFTCSPESMARLRRRVARVCEVVARYPALTTSAWFRDYIEFEIPLQLLGAIASPSTSSEVPGRQARLIALDRARAFVRENLAKPPRIRELCEQAGVSWRTLNYAFRELLDTTPQAYLKAIRLDAARRELRLGAYPAVNEAAHACGFWHMGKFAADYREHFGELPSETLRKARGGDADVDPSSLI